MDFHALVTYTLDYLQANWTTITAYLAAGGGVSVLLQLFKRLRKWESKAWIQFVLAVFSGLAATADYIISNYNTSPLSQIFGDMAPKILVAALLMHRIAVNPISKLVEKYVQGLVTKAATKAANRVSVTGQITPHVTTVDPIPAEPQDVL